MGTCLLTLKNGLSYKNLKPTLDPFTGKDLSQEKIIIKDIKNILSGLLSKNNDVDTLNKTGKLSVLSSKVLDDQDIASLTYDEL